MLFSSLIPAYIKCLVLACLTLSASGQQCSSCHSYGIDFQNGGTYFQNTLSTDNFTFVTEYQGCQNDTVLNALVLPSGDEFYCSDTLDVPDNADQFSSCPITKNQLVSGEYTIIVESNNGDTGCDPFAFQRDFTVVAGPQSTTTYTPTVIFTSTSTPVVNVTATSTSTVTSTSTPYTTITTGRPPKGTPPPPPPSTSTRYTFSKTSTCWSYGFRNLPQWVVATPSCSIPTRALTPDPTATLLPGVLPPLPGLLEDRAITKRAPERRETRIRERKERIAALGIRAPDPSVVTVTDTNTNDFVTSTSTVYASTVTSTTTITTTSTTTTILPTVTVIARGTNSPITSSQKQSTVYTTIWQRSTITWARTTITTKPVYTITSTPRALSTSCKSAGGKLV